MARRQDPIHLVFADLGESCLRLLLGAHRFLYQLDPKAVSSLAIHLRRRHGVSIGSVAVAWTLRNPAVDGAIVGFRHPEQVDPIVEAANLELTDEDITEIEGGN